MLPALREIADVERKFDGLLEVVCGVALDAAALDLSVGSPLLISRLNFLFITWHTIITLVFYVSLAQATHLLINYYKITLHSLPKTLITAR